MAKESSYEKAENRLLKWGKIVSAIAIIVGSLTALCSWVSNQFAIAVSEQISIFQEEMENATKRHEQSVTRVELLALMEHDPDNLAAIEKIARYYFKDLNGDLYMTQKYSDWASKHGGDITIVVGDK